jgi:hypothetical protein
MLDGRPTATNVVSLDPEAAKIVRYVERARIPWERVLFEIDGDITILPEDAVQSFREAGEEEFIRRGRCIHIPVGMDDSDVACLPNDELPLHLDDGNAEAPAPSETEQRAIQRLNGTWQCDEKLHTISDGKLCWSDGTTSSIRVAAAAGHEDDLLTTLWISVARRRVRRGELAPGGRVLLWDNDVLWYRLEEESTPSLLWEGSFAQPWAADAGHWYYYEPEAIADQMAAREQIDLLLANLSC